MIVNDVEYPVAGKHFTGEFTDGLILSLSTKPTIEQMKRFRTEKDGVVYEKKAGVIVTNLKRVREAFDKQLGVKSTSGRVLYTERSDRNHFLKSKKDDWQTEYRLFWPTIPAGGSAQVKVPEGCVVPLDLARLK